MSSLAALEAARGQLIDQIASITAAIDSNQRSLRSLESSLPFARTDAERTQIRGNITILKEQIARGTAELQRLTQELADIDQQIAQARTQEGPRESAGQTVAQAQAANDDRADVVAPSAPPAVAAVPGNAQRFRPNADAGTNATRRPATSTQAIPPNTANPGGVPGTPNEDGGPKPNASIQGGAAAGGDDRTGGSGVRAALNKIFDKDIIPEANVLDQYASYSYNISIYLMSPQDLKQLLLSNSPPKGAQLILRSGGAPQAGGTLPATVDPQEVEQAADGNGAPLIPPDLGRNPNFPLDYYLDDVRLTSFIAGKGANLAHNVFRLQFKVIEPNGISFLDNLYKATKQYVQLTGSPQVNYAAQNYLMVIRFYGYDKDGNLVLAQNKPMLDPITNTASQTIVEKYIPFQFTNIQFRVANKAVEYDCQAVGIVNAVATSPKRGVIPYNVELTSQSLKDLLQGKQTFLNSGEVSDAFRQGPDQSQAETTRLLRQNAQTNVGTSFAARQEAASATVRAARREQLGLAPETVAAAPLPVTAGTGATQNSAPPKASAATSKTLVTGLVDALNSAQDEWVAKKAIEYPDRYFIELDPLLAEAKVVPPGRTDLKQTPMADNEGSRKLLPATQAVDSNARKFSILAGTSIVQFLDQVTRNTDYIYDQQTKYYDPKTKKLIPNGKPANIVGWYRIGMQVVPQGADRYDRIRNDYAYDITYKVEVYGINDAKSDFFPGARHRGVHKRYDYWFTGVNTQVLDFTQDFNYLYYLVNNAASQPRTSTTNWREAIPRSPQPRSDQSDQMNEGPVSEPSAQLADYLYSPGDTARVKLRIVGDPAWIQQGDIRSGLVRDATLYEAFLPDGTVNFAGQEPLFEILWNKPVDYDLPTGLIDPGTTNFGVDRPAGISGDATQSHVYKAVICTSIFNRGSFTQELEGSQIYFDVPAKDTAETQREQQPESANRQGTLDTGDETARLLSRYPPPKPTTTSVTGTQPTSSLAKGVQQALRAPAAAPATSSTEIVGTPNESAAETNRLLGTARGQAVGPPTARLYLNNNQVVEVTSQAEIQQYVNQSSPQARNAAAARLNIAQQAANNPTSATSSQIMNRDF